MTDSRQQTRKHMRALRSTLTTEQQQLAATSLLNQCPETLFQTGKHIAFYYACAGEIDPTPIIEAAWQIGSHCYLPVIAKNEDKVMRFALYNRQTELCNNRYGIPEPSDSKQVTAAELDIVLLPLVAFDQYGNRLGMGGGYYDQTFAFLKENRNSKPFLFGLAHEFQKVDKIPNTHWDIPLHAIITDKRIYIPEEFV